jgi:hypothetical protein
MSLPLIFNVRCKESSNFYWSKDKVYKVERGIIFSDNGKPYYYSELRLKFDIITPLEELL